MHGNLSILSITLHVLTVGVFGCCLGGGGGMMNSATLHCLNITDGCPIHFHLSRELKMNSNMLASF